MKSYKNLIFLFTLAIAAFSCKKNVIEYKSIDVDGQAEFQLHYFVPVVSGAVNNIYKVEINGEVYSSAASPLVTYNAIPSGAVGRFYATKPGQNNIKLYRGDALELVYDQNCELKTGKQNIFVYDLAKPPIVLNNDYPYTPVITDSTARIAWVKFHNFLFEKAGEPTTLKLQYQRQYVTNVAAGTKSDWINVGKPVAFGEVTDWVQIDVIKTDTISSSSARIDYRIRMIGANGEDQGDLQVLNSSDKFVNYSDWWTGFVGRRYFHILSGMRAEKPTSAVRQFTAL